MSGMDDILPPYELLLDYFTIGGDRSPGKCEVRGAGREWEWAELLGWGLDGASQILRRRVLVEFEIDVTLTTQTDLSDWDDFYGKWLAQPAYRAGKRSPTPPVFKNAIQAVGGAGFGDATTPAASTQTQASRGLGIYHPRLARVGIGAAVVKKVGQFVQSRTGGETCTIFFKEYRAPKFILSKPNGTIPGAAKPVPKSKDALDEAIAVETQRNTALTAYDQSIGNLKLP